jgi:hypothetical protein
MSNSIYDIKESVKNIITNLHDLDSDIDDLELDHDHDTWGCSDCEEIKDEAAREVWDNISITDIMDNAWSEYEAIKEEGAEEERDTQRLKLAAFSTMLYNLADFAKKWDDLTVATFEHNALAIRNVLHPNRVEEKKTEEVVNESEVAY